MENRNTLECQDCKQTFPVAAFQYPKGKTGKTSTGSWCKECRTKRQRLRDREPRNRWSQTKVKAKIYGVEFQLAYEDYAALLAVGACHYCGGPLPKTGRGIDRKDSDKPYTAENCVPACSQCNQVKNSNIFYREMLEVGALFAKFRKIRAENGEAPLDSWQAIRRKGW